VPVTRVFWLVSAALALAAAGCAKPLDQTNLFSQSVSVREDYSKPPVITSTVKRGAEYKVAVTFAWETPGGVGRHRRTWKFYRDGVLYGQDSERVNFRQSPFTLELDATSIDKEPGDYQYQLELDGQDITTINVTIVE
jgi:hypothetical protein